MELGVGSWGSAEAGGRSESETHIGDQLPGKTTGPLLSPSNPKFYSLEKGYLLLCYTSKTFSDLILCISA